MGINQKLGENGTIVADPLEEGEPVTRLSKAQLNFKISIMVLKQLMTNSIDFRNQETLSSSEDTDVSESVMFQDVME